MAHFKVTFLTGLSGAGKTTIGRALTKELERRGYPVEFLDNDVVRETLSPDLGFSKEDREENIRRVVAEMKHLAGQGKFVVAAFIAPYCSMRAHARKEIGDSFCEVYVDAPLEVCIKRDPKGLYAKARRGEISNLTGMSEDAPYEPPVFPEVTVNTDEKNVEECVFAILQTIGISPISSARRIA